MVAELYYTPTSCGAASYIAAYKAGILGSKVNAYEADIRAKKVLTGPKAGQDFFAINYKGNVPTLVLEDGTVLNEGAAVLQWIADQAPQSGLAPANGTSERYLLQAKLNYVASEVHRSYGPLFNPALTPEQKEFFVTALKVRFCGLGDDSCCVAGKLMPYHHAFVFCLNDGERNILQLFFALFQPFFSHPHPHRRPHAICTQKSCQLST